MLSTNDELGHDVVISNQSSLLIMVVIGYFIHHNIDQCIKQSITSRDFLWKKQTRAYSVEQME